MYNSYIVYNIIISPDNSSRVTEEGVGQNYRSRGDFYKHTYIRFCTILNAALPYHRPFVKYMLTNTAGENIVYVTYGFIRVLFYARVPKTRFAKRLRAYRFKKKHD